MSLIFAGLLALLTVIVYPGDVRACDACSSGLTETPTGLYPQQNVNSIGLQYSSSVYGNTLIEQTSLFGGHSHGGDGHSHSHGGDGHSHSHGGGVEEEVTYREVAREIRLHGVWYPASKWRLSASVPFQDTRLFNENESERIELINGLGDVMTRVNYRLLDKQTFTENHHFRHKVLVGGGVEWPTGRYDEVGFEGEVRPQEQPGSGSFDFLAEAQYLFKFDEWMLHNRVAYRVNTANPDGFKYGNRIQAAVNFYRELTVEEVTIMPNVGFVLEHADKDKVNGEPYQFPTGGEFVKTSAGIGAKFGSISVNGSVRIPILRATNGTQLEETYSWRVGIRYLFNNS